MECKNPKDDIFELALEWADKGRRAAIATVVSTWGSASRQAGSQLIVDSGGAFEGSVSGGCVEPAVITEALDVIKTGVPKMLSFGVSDEQAWEVGLICGGRIDIYIQSLDVIRPVLERVIKLKRDGIPSCIITDLDGGDAITLDLGAPDLKDKISPELKDFVFDAIKRGVCAACNTGEKRYYLHGIYPATRLIIIGAVDIARVLSQIASLSNYSTVIIDPRGAFATRERFPDVELLVEWPDDALSNMNLHRRTAIVTLTHDPKIDDVALKEALRSGAFYIGALGSRKTHSDRLERLRSEGFSEEDLSRIHGPVGLDLGAKTHAEIAVAILAEIIKRHREGKEEGIRWPLTQV
ncbi:XdhC family protein [bacterium]|nr:XdhC family protein [bacterium]